MSEIVFLLEQPEVFAVFIQNSEVLSEFAVFIWAVRPDLYFIWVMGGNELAGSSLAGRFFLGKKAIFPKKNLQ